MMLLQSSVNSCGSLPLLSSNVPSSSSYHKCIFSMYKDTTQYTVCSEIEYVKISFKVTQVARYQHMLETVFYNLQHKRAIHSSHLVL